jgi:rhamnosyltransferase subunit B
MRLMIVTLGTAGDVFPMLGIAKSMRERGHEVHLACTPEYGDRIRQFGFIFHTLHGIPGATEAPDYYHPTRSMRLVAQRLLIPAIEPVFSLLSSVCRGNDWLVVANCHCYGARIAQEHEGLPLLTCVVTPFHLRSVESMPITPGLACPPWAPRVVRAAFSNFVSRLWDRELAGSLNGFRATLKLPPVDHIWYDWSLSPQRVLGLFPSWFAPKPNDWPGQFVHCGFTTFDQGASDEVPAQLLENGPPLVVFAAGSAGGAAAGFFQAAVSASDGQPWRAVLLTGKLPSGSDSVQPRNVYRFQYVPMSRLLPLSSVIVHHGGLGTISLALSAGVPQIAAPIGHDQFDNAARLERLGVGRSIRSNRNLSPALGRAIAATLQDASRLSRCRELRGEASIASSLDLICRQIEADFDRFGRGRPAVAVAG